MTFKVVDLSAEGVPDITVIFEKYNEATNTYTTVAMDKTDSDGNGQVYLDINNVKYRIILEQNGEVVQTYTPMLISCTDTPCLTLEINPSSYESFWDYSDKIGYSCSFDKSTRVLHCDVTDTSGVTQTDCLNISEIGVAGIVPYYSVCDSGSSVTLTKTLPKNETYGYSLSVKFNDGKTYTFISDIIEWVGSPMYGLTGVVAAFVIFIFLAMFGIWNPTASIILGTIGIVVSVYLGVLSIGIGSLIGLVIAAGVLIWRMRG